MTAPWSLPLILRSKPLLTGVLGALLMLSACMDEGTPPVDGPLLSLRALDASCTEVWLEVRLAAGVSPRTISLRRDSVPILTTTLRSTDTLVVDEGLSPNRRYAYTLTQPGGLSTGPASASIVTMDTTSHEFTWQMDTLGVTASSLNDVVIINDTLAYAVGETYLRDSSGNLDPILYNAAHWDGTRWNIIRIPYVYQGQTFYGALRAVFAFGANDVWFGSGNMIHWNGRNFTSVEIPAGVWGPYSMNKIWGSPAGELYVVGNSGAIAHRSASGMWRRIESGTTLPMRGIHGSRGSDSEEYQILCVAEAYGVPGGSKILSIEGDRVREVAAIGLESWGLRAIWFARDRKYVAVGAGIWKSRSAEGPWQEDTTLPGLWKSFVCGEALNNLLAGGASILHFQGSRWQTLRSGVSLAAGAMEDNRFIAVGGIGNRAMAVRGTRYP